MKRGLSRTYLFEGVLFPVRLAGHSENFRKRSTTYTLRVKIREKGKSREKCSVREHTDLVDDCEVVHACF